MPSITARKVYKRIRRRARIKRIRKGKVNMSTEIHKYRRRTLLYGEGGAINNAIQTTINAGGGFAADGFNIKLDQLPNVGEFAVLYDSYRIDYVKLYINCTSAGMDHYDAWTNRIGLPILYIVHDTDDVSAPTANKAGCDLIREYGKVKRLSFSANKNTVVFGFKPNLLLKMYYSALTDAYAPTYNKFVDMTKIDIPFYGIKFVIEVPTAGTPLQVLTFTMDAEFFFTCKSTR